MFLGVLVSLIAYSDASVSGKKVIRELLPDNGNTNYGAGFNSVNLCRIKTNPVVYEKLSSRGGSSPRSNFISQSFQMKHYKNRDELKTEFDNAEITASESLMGTSKSKFARILSDNNLSVLDSFILVDIDVVTNVEHVQGLVTLAPLAQNLLAAGNYTQFISQYGTHYLRKKVFGAKLLFLVKIKSFSKQEKAQVDDAMEKLIGSIGDDADFKRRMETAKKLGRLEMSLFSLGGPTYQGDLEFDKVIDFALNFIGKVPGLEEVIENEYLGIWSLQNIPRAFASAIFKYQQTTDGIINIFSGLRDVEKSISDIGYLRFSEMSWLTNAGWNKLQAVAKDSKSKRNSLQQRLKSEEIDQLETVRSEFDGISTTLEAQVEQIILTEKRYTMGSEMTLKLSGKHRYMSNPSNSYARVSPYYPLTMYMDKTKSSGGGYSHPLRFVALNNEVVHLRSPDYPGQLLCMAKNSYYVFWYKETDAYFAYCSWTLQHAADPRKQYLEYGDEFVLVNLYWDTWLLGVADDLNWAKTRKRTDLTLKCTPGKWKNRITVQSIKDVP